MLSDNRLCACSSDHSIKIFDIHTGNDFNLKVDKQQAHSEEIRCIEEIQINILASGSKNDIKICHFYNYVGYTICCIVKNANLVQKILTESIFYVIITERIFIILGILYIFWQFSLRGRCE